MSLVLNMTCTKCDGKYKMSTSPPALKDEQLYCEKCRHGDFHSLFIKFLDEFSYGHKSDRADYSVMIPCDRLYELRESYLKNSDKSRI